MTCLRVVVGPGLVSTSPAFMRSIASHPVGPHGWLARKNGNHSCVRYYVFVKSSFKHTREECESKRAYVF